jgi:very-short-patch-repair endonuclease/predicted transcriptional regulator of viral defense system
MPPAGPEASRYRTDPDRRAPAERRERAGPRERAERREPAAQREPAEQREPAAQRERAIQELAARQHRMLSLPQLKVLGLTASAVRSRVAAGKLRRVHQGVYVVGLAPLSIESIYMAAVLACGPKAALAHRSAAAHLGLRPCNRQNVDVIAPDRTGKGRKGIDVHRATGLEPRDITTVDGIPTTTVARTLLDLATTLHRAALERAVEQAEKLRIFDLAAVVDVTTRACDRRAATNLRNALAVYTPEPAFTRSELEKRFLALCRAAGVPTPRTNNVTGSDEIDFTWPDRRLMVETDSLRHHGTRAAFERDRRRDQQLTAAGWRVVRFTWRQVHDTPADVAATLRALLAT